MELIASMGLSEDIFVFFVAGVAVGALVLASIQSAFGGSTARAALSQRVTRLEIRLVAARDFKKLSPALMAVAARLPLTRNTGVVTLFAGPASPSHDASPLPDTQQIAREFGEAMHANTGAAVEIAKAIIDAGVNLNDPKDRREVASRIRKSGQLLSGAFWDHYGDALMASAAPASLKELLKAFFAQVKRLKSAVNDLAKQPEFADLDALLEKVIDLLDTAKSIMDELEKALAS